MPLLLLWVAWSIRRDLAARRPFASPPTVPSHVAWVWATIPRVDVCALSIGVDWRARRFVQQRLEQLARGDTSSPTGLAGLLRATVETLTSVRLGWLYAGAYNAEPMLEAQAQAEFLRIAADLRSRFRHELLRNADGALQTTDAPELRARPEEGEGVVVVSLVVAARTDLRNLLQPRDAQALRQVLESLGRLGPSQLVAMEVIWSPAAEDDRMSTAELEALYPELRRIDEGTIGGRIFCPYCAGPYAAELAKCPHCGAPRPA